MSKRFNKKNSQKYVVVHRPHDDPEYYNDEAPEHVLVPAFKSGTSTNGAKVTEKSTILARRKGEQKNEHVGDAILYGINFDDSKYDYTQHLKPIGTDPENSLFIPAKSSLETKNRLDDLFLEPQYLDIDQHPNPKKNYSNVFAGGLDKVDYLKHQQDVAEELIGFRPDMNPGLREVLEALDDEAYVVNKDRSLKRTEEQSDYNDDDDIFKQLLEGGEATTEAEELEDNLYEWDAENPSSYEDENYQKELEALDNVENLEDLKNIDYQTDVKRFKKELERGNHLEAVESSSILASEEQEVEEDNLGELPNIKHQSQKQRRKTRQKMGAKSNLTGFSMSSSAIARTESMTILDDHYDNVISGYENYQEEQEKLEEKQSKPFSMEQERSDFESLLDEFLDNYELGKGGREFHKKDKEVQNMKRAADEVSKGKLSRRRNRERDLNNGFGTLSSLSNLHI